MKIVNWESFCDSYKSSASTFLHKMVTNPIPLPLSTILPPLGKSWEAKGMFNWKYSRIRLVPMEYTLEIAYFGIHWLEIII